MDDIKETGDYEPGQDGEAMPAPQPQATADAEQPAEPVMTAVEEPPPAPEAVAAEPALAPKKKDPESWVETVKTVVYALLIALVIRTFFFQPFNIPSASMQGTLAIGDYLFVEKFAYGYSKHSFPFSLAPFSGRVFSSAPTRGDVVVFKMPNEKSDDYMKDYIKRVIGLPGDRIQMINDRLYINDKIVPRVRVQDYLETSDGITTHVAQFRETLPNGKSYLTLDRMTDGPLDSTGVFVVPPDHYFMMGDNRDNSDDSREDVGYVPAENLVGKAEFIFFSIDVGNNWLEFWRWPGEIRYSRMISGID